MPLSIAKGPFAGRARVVGLTLAPALALALARPTTARRRAQTASAPASATSTPPSPTRFVTDGAGFLSAPAQDELEQRLARYERDTGHQVLLWIGQTTGGEPIESWAVRAFAAWRVGRKGLDDGVAVFILAADRKRPDRGGVWPRRSRPRCDSGADHRRSDDSPAPRRGSGRRRTRRRLGRARGAGRGSRRAARRCAHDGRTTGNRLGSASCPRTHRDPGARVHRDQPQAGVDAADDDRVELRPRRRQLGRGRRGGGGWGGGGGGGFSGGGGRSGGGGASGSW